MFHMEVGDSGTKYPRRTPAQGVGIKAGRKNLFMKSKGKPVKKGKGTK